jgi:hypothetical protein
MACSAALVLEIAFVWEVETAEAGDDKMSIGCLKAS